ncbi:hypothetical protein F5Y03DRAFT_408953 [Xylaria venustula]|nr:hypothetical protein F5Y03DRAFT_408953 [Xylaria venustula]
MSASYHSHIFNMTYHDETNSKRTHGLHQFAIATSTSEGEYHPLAPNTEMFRSLSVAVNLGLEILESQAGRRALAELGHAFVARQARRSQHHAFAGDLNRMENYVDHFLDSVRNQYPLVGVQQENDQVICTTSPGLVSSDLHSFHPENAGIFTYNIDLVNIMVDAQNVSLRATKLADKRSSKDRWRNFVFIFACATLHQLADLFTAYLSPGRTYPPPLLRDPKRVGGRWLECRLYGGSLEIYKSHNQSPDDPGMLCLVDESYNIVRRIDPRAITECLENPQGYRFPFPSIGEDITIARMRTLGYQNTASTSSFGVTLPHNARAMREFVARPELLRYSLPVEDLRLTPFRAKKRYPSQTYFAPVHYHETEVWQPPSRTPVDVVMVDA